MPANESRAVSNSWCPASFSSRLRGSCTAQSSVVRLALDARASELIVVDVRARGLRSPMAIETVRRQKRLVILESIRPRPTSTREKVVDRVHGILVGATAKRVVAFGRAACGWETVFAAAALSGDWQLTVICEKSDNARVHQLNNLGTTVLVDVSGETHDHEVTSAKVDLLALPKGHASAEFIRPMETTGLGVPAVATQVDGLEGYLKYNVTAAVIPHSSSHKMAKPFFYYLSDQQEADTLVERAQSAVRSNSVSRYLTKLEEQILA